MNIKVILFIIALIALLVFQAKVVMPYVKDIAASDLFLEVTGDEQNRESNLNLMTESAFKQCNNYVATEVLPDATLTFSKEPLNAFGLGNYQYVINADIEISPQNVASFTKRYACRIKYLKADDNMGVSSHENWSIDAISGLNDL